MSAQNENEASILLLFAMGDGPAGQERGICGDAKAIGWVRIQKEGPYNAMHWRCFVVLLSVTGIRFAEFIDPHHCTALDPILVFNVPSHCPCS